MVTKKWSGTHYLGLHVTCSCELAWEQGYKNTEENLGMRLRKSWRVGLGNGTIKSRMKLLQVCLHD